MTGIYGGVGRSSGDSPGYLSSYKDSDEAFEELFVKGNIPERLKDEISTLKQIMKEIIETPHEGQRQESNHGTDLKDQPDSLKLKKSSIDENSNAGDNSGEPEESNRNRKPKKSASHKKTKEKSKNETNISTRCHSPKFNTDTKATISKTTENDDYTKRTIEKDHENAANSWKCKHCTLDNPNTGYICYVCGKSNEEQRGRITSENVDMEKHRQRPGKSSKNTLNVSKQSDTDESDDDNTPITSSDESKYGNLIKVNKNNMSSPKPIYGKDSKDQGNVVQSKSKNRSAGGHSITDTQIPVYITGGSRANNHIKKPETKRTGDKKAKEPKKGSDRLTVAHSDDSGAAILGLTSKVTHKKVANKQSIGTYHDNVDNSWKCEHCTVDNPHNKYICDVCGKTNDEQRRRIVLATDKGENNKRPPGKLSADRLTKFEQRSDIQGKSAPKNKQTEIDDTEPNVQGYSDDEDPFEYIDKPGVKSYSEAVKTDQFGGNIQNKQSIGRLDKSHDDYSGEKSNEQWTVTHWTCEHCTFDNPLNQYICKSCGKTNDQLRPTIGNETGADQDDAMEYNDDRDRSLDWSCEHCTTYNPFNQYVCKGCSKTNKERRATIGNEEGAVQKHIRQTNKSNHDYAMVEQDTTQEQSLTFYQRSINAISNGLRLVFGSNDEIIREGLQRIMTFMQIPWDSQNNEIKTNYKHIIASGRMESGSQEAETAAILKYIYPEIDVNIIVKSLLQHKNIEQTIKTITKHLKKK